MHLLQAVSEPLALGSSPPPHQMPHVHLLEEGTDGVVGLGKVSNDHVLVRPPGSQGLKQGCQRVRPLRQDVVVGKPRVVAVQAAIGNHPQDVVTEPGFATPWWLM